MTSTPPLAALPAPRDPDPRSAPVLGWGVLAPGWIAGNFARALTTRTDQRLVAVDSRDAAKAAAFAAEHGAARSYGSYAGVLEDPQVDVVYIASPHSQHREHALAAIAAGKHVLVEKPMARNASEAREIAAAGRAAGVLVMEAMWTRYLPRTDVLRQLLEDGALGDVRHVQADFGSRPTLAPGSRLLDPALAGGVLLDIGVYPIAFASYVLRAAGLPWQPPLAVSGSVTSTGVDEEVALQIAVPGAHAQVFTSMLTRSAQSATVVGGLARAELGPQFFAPGSLTVVGEDDATLVWEDRSGIEGLDGLCYQAAALARYVADGRTESPLLGLEESIAVLEVTDAARATLGVVYPGE